MIDVNNKNLLQEAEAINLRSEEVCEIMGQVPNRIIRYGISVFTVIILALFVFSFFFRYPDVIEGRFYVQSSYPPAFMVARSTGKIQSLMVRDSEKVESGDVLAVIENATSYDSFLKVKSLLHEDLFSEMFLMNVSSLDLGSGLGELQPAFSSFQKAIVDYYSFLTIDYHNKKQRGIATKLKELNNYIKYQSHQLELSEDNHRIAKGMFKRDSILFVNKTIAALDYENSQRELVMQKISLTNVELAVSNAFMSRTDLEQEILEIELDYQQQDRMLRSIVYQTAEQMKGVMAEWEKKYCLVSPFDGVVAFSGVWEVNQNVSVGQHVMTIVPSHKSDFVCKIAIPVQRAGKISISQPVNLKFTDFPHQEYGMVVGTLNTISLVPDSTYIGTVVLTDSLYTNYGKILPFKQNMQGEAEIITENISLAERFIYPLKALYKQRIQ